MRPKRRILRRSSMSRRADAILGQRAVQVDHVRHDRGAEDAGGQQDRVRAGEVGHEALGRLAGVEADAQRVVQEAQQDHAEHPGDGQLEAAVAAVLQREDGEGDDGGDEARGEQRDAEQQVQRDRRADELGQVGGHRDQLGLDPQADGHRPREALAAQLGQVLAGGGADLGRQRLDQHRHQVRGQDHPQQQVAELGAAGDVRGEVAGVDVGDGGDERRAEHRQQRAHAAAGADALEVAGRDPAGLDGGVDGAHRRSSTRIARASEPPSTWTSSPWSKRAKTGPSNGCLSTISKAAPGKIPRSAR